jgi:catechol 2,3-dioxygenase-like lactoylglutathione lyase family enzyme
MIGYITLGTNDLQRAAAFYDELLVEFGARRIMTDVRMIGWGTQAGQPMLSVIIPFDEQPATPGNGTMIAFTAENAEAVQRIHAKALSLGARDEGQPGERGDSGFYWAYFRDLDGNKFAVSHGLILIRPSCIADITSLPSAV